MRKSILLWIGKERPFLGGCNRRAAYGDGSHGASQGCFGPLFVSPGDQKTDVKLPIYGVLVPPDFFLLPRNDAPWTQLAADTKSFQISFMRFFLVRSNILHSKYFHYYYKIRYGFSLSIYMGQNLHVSTHKEYHYDLAKASGYY